MNVILTLFFDYGARSILEHKDTVIIKAVKFN